MSIPRQIKEYLEAHHVPYRHCVHEPAIAARETARAQHVSSRQMARTAMVQADGRLVVMVLPASHYLERRRLRAVLNASAVRLATEKEFAREFPGCEPGAMPPLGSLFDHEVWIDASLREDDVIVFNAGTRADTIQMSFADFDRLVQPYLGDFATTTH
jgi:Ala-tRNA(Pro) deacylase